MKDKKKAYVIVALIVIAIIAIAIYIVKTNLDRKTSFEGENATSNVVLERIEFKNITKTYEAGITTIRADVYNNTKVTKDINVQIILKDENGKEIKNMIQAIEEIEPGRKKILQTGITGDYTSIKDVEFKVLEDKDLEQYNK